MFPAVSDRTTRPSLDGQRGSSQFRGLRRGNPNSLREQLPWAYSLGLSRLAWQTAVWIAARMPIRLSRLAWFRLAMIA